MIRFGALALSIVTLSACSAIRPAEMRLPPPLAGQAGAPMLGVNGWQGGKLTFAGYQGTYKRSNWTSSWFDTFKSTGGRNRFTLTGPELSGQLSADCRMMQKELTSSTISVITRPLAYRCDFLIDGRSFPARFELQEAQTPVINRYARMGEIALGGEVVQFRSVHDLKGTTLPTSTPIGYVFEQAGVPVGAITLNGTPRLISAPSASAGLQRTIAVASVAIALMRDPE